MSIYLVSKGISMFLKQELEVYKNNRSNSLKNWNKSNTYLAGGISHNIRAFGLPGIDSFPISIEKAQGAYLEDLDGNSYTDYWCGHFSMILGHNHPDVLNAVGESIRKGWHYGTLTESQVKLAELLATNPGIEKMRFCTSGTAHYNTA